MVNLECTLYKSDNGDLKVNESIYNEIYGIMNKLNEEGNVFAGKRDRLDFAPWSFLIKYNGEGVGFIYVTKEHRYQAGLFIDMAIIKEYRGLGIGKQALEQLLDEVKTQKFLIGEIKKNNEVSNKLGNDIGIKILEGEYNYYLFPKDRYEEFMEFNKDKKFEDAMLKANMNNTEVLQLAYEEEYNKPKKLIKK